MLKEKCPPTTKLVLNSGEKNGESLSTVIKHVYLAYLNKIRPLPEGVVFFAPLCDLCAMPYKLYKRLHYNFVLNQRSVLFMNVRRVIRMIP